MIALTMSFEFFFSAFTALPRVTPALKLIRLERVKIKEIKNLLHDELDVLLLDALGVNGFVVLLGGRVLLDDLGLLGGLSRLGDVLDGVALGGGDQILGLGLAKDDVGIGTGCLGLINY